jgi:hypothetical protein
MLSNLSMTTWAWNRIEINTFDEATNDLGWSHTQEFPLLGGQSLQRVIVRLGSAGSGSTIGPIFGLVPAPWLLRLTIDTLSPRGFERIYNLGHAAELHAEPQFDDTSPETPWDFQFSIPAFDVDMQPHLGIPEGNSGSLLRVSYGLVSAFPQLPSYFQYASSFTTLGQISYLVSSQP